MALFGGFAKKFKKIFGPKKPQQYGEAEAQKIMEGQAARREKLLQRRVAKGKSSEVYKNKKLNAPTNFYFNGRVVSDSPPLELFLDGFPYARFASSNVRTIVYDRRSEDLFIQYIRRRGNDLWYRYQNVSKAEATQFYAAVSKGVTVWDYLRVRGTQTGFKKPYSRGTPPPSDLPLVDD